MAGWTTYAGNALLLPRANVDTDQLIPARFMSTPRSEGYGKFLLHDLRHDEDGKAKPDFPVNTHPDATILVAGPNFGSGSSREAAVYALVDAGFKAVIAPSFGDIFASNAVNNGLLPARVDDATAQILHDMLADGTKDMAIDLEAGTLETDDQSLTFALQDNWRTKLINGWDDIDLTLQHADAIDDFRKQRRVKAAWAWPAAADR